MTENFICDNRHPVGELKTEPRKHSKKLASLILIILILIILNFLPSKTLLTSNKSLNTASLFLTKNTNFKALFKETEKDENINILILGISGGNHISPDLTDSIIILRVNAKKQKGLVVSIPRDLYVKTPTTNEVVKINSIYKNNGIETLFQKIKEITKIDINLYVIVDLNSLKTIIDDIGGLYLPSSYSQTDQNQLINFDGQKVLNYVRLRPDSDFGRIKRQQLVIEALHKKIVSLNPFFDFERIYQIFNTVKSNLSTNMSLAEIKKIFKAYRHNDFQTTYITLDTNNLLKSQMINTDLGYQYVLIPIDGFENYQKIQSYLAAIEL